MGRETKTFRQTKRAGGADSSAKAYAKINRQGSWGNRTGNILKLNELPRSRAARYQKQVLVTGICDRAASCLVLCDNKKEENNKTTYVMDNSVEQVHQEIKAGRIVQKNNG